MTVLHRGVRRGTARAAALYAVELLERRLLLVAGALDGTFANNGVSALAGFDLIDAAPLSDGGTVALLSDRNNPGADALARFDNAGNLDSTFGVNGIAEAGFIAGDPVTAVAVQSNGDILVAGTSSTQTPLVYRFLPSGELDSTGFGTGGTFTQTTPTTGLFSATTLVVRGDDRIVVGGTFSAAGALPITDMSLIGLTKDGAIDNSFGAGDGEVLIGLSGADAAAGSSALLGDGRIVATAVSDFSTGVPQVVVTRLTADGVPDTTFNGSGRLAVASTTIPSDAARHIAISADDRFALFSPAVAASQERVLVFNADGTADATFGSGGIADLNIPLSQVQGVPVDNGGVGFDATGRIVVSIPASNSGKGGTDVVRLNADGSPDTTFGPSGARVFTGIGSGPRRLFFGPDKTILLAANQSADPARGADLVLARVDSSRPPTPVILNGVVPDATNNTFSVTVMYVGDVAVDATTIDGGDVSITGPQGYNPSNLDVRNITTSGTDVTATYDFTAPGGTVGDEDNGTYTVSVNAIEVLDVHGNSVVPGAVASFKVVIGPPVLTIGGLDPTFGGTGLVSKALGFNGTGGVAAQEDGKVVVAGFGGPPGAQDIGLARFNPNGTADSTFGGGDGVEFLDVRGTDDVVADVKVMGDGRILVCGTTSEVVGGQTVGSDFFIARFLQDGTPDPAFNGTGIAIADFAADPTTNPSTDVARSLVRLPSSTIIVAGRSDAAGATTDFALAAFNDDGSLDTGFGDGKVLIDFAGADDGAQAVVGTSKGAVVAAGYATVGGQRRIGVVQLTPAGVLDRRFGSGGKIVTSTGGESEQANAVAVGPKGVIVVAGASSTGGGSDGRPFASDFVVARYTAAGKPDGKFGARGIASASFGVPANATAVQVGLDGRILASGVTSPDMSQGEVGGIQLAVARFTATGAPDTSFGGISTPPGTIVVPLASATSPSLQSAPAQSISPAQVRPFAADTTMSIDQFRDTTEGKLAGKVGGGAYDAGTDAGETNVAALVTDGAELSASLVARLPAAILSGSKESASVLVANLGDQTAAGVMAIRFFESKDQILDDGDTLILSLPSEPLNLKPLTLGGKPKSFKASLTLPPGAPDGSYFILAQVNAGESIPELNFNNDTAFTGNPVEISAPFIDLTGNPLPGGFSLPQGKSTTLAIPIANKGNIPVKAAVELVVSLSADMTPDSGDTLLPPVTAKLAIKPGGTEVVRARLTIPQATPVDSYYVFVRIDAANAVPESDETNNLLASVLASHVT